MRAVTKKCVRANPQCECLVPTGREANGRWERRERAIEMWRKLIILSAITYTLAATTYEVGPGKTLTSIGAVPWESLQPGDLVLIDWQSTPYREKWVICLQGTAANPITVRGVAGPAGQLPVIEGDGATTRPQLNYWNEVRGLLKIGGANVPPDTTPQYIVI